MRYALILIMLAAPASLSAQELTPVEYYRLRQRADSMQRNADLAGSEAILRRLIAHDARDPEIWHSLAKALDTQRKTADAIAAYHKVIELGYGYTANHLYSIARLRAQLGQRDSSLAYLRQALAARWPYRERLRTDPAFESFRSDAELRKLVGIPPENLTRDQKWQFDLDYLVEEAKRLHTSFDRFAYRPAFDSAAAALRKDIPRLDDATVIARMRALLVQLDDGHTGVFFESAPRLPITLYWFKDGVFVIAAPGDTTLRGSKVIAVEGVAVDEALRRVTPFITRDNDMGVRAVAPIYITQRPVLKAAGILRDSTGARVTLQTRNGQTKMVTLSFAPPPANANRAEPVDSARLPLYLQRRNVAYWLKPLPNARAVYFQFNGVRNETGNPIPQFAKQLTQTLDSTRARALIVDLRHNGGGNSYLFPPLIRAMIVFKEKSPEHQVFVITSRNTFSAAQNFAVAIDQWVGATFVGEPTGSRANFVGESDVFRLPATNTRANISWRWHQYAQWVDHRKWIAPHIPAEPTSQDYFSGRDRALEAILEVLGAKIT